MEHRAGTDEGDGRVTGVQRRLQRPLASLITRGVITAGELAHQQLASDA